nr:hypothetical protein BaRGS_028121 [Batillaria attramentaria]
MDVRNTQASCIMAAQPARQSARVCSVRGRIVVPSSEVMMMMMMMMMVVVVVVTWQPKRNGPVQIFSEKLHWHAVSTIPKASPRREDALARDPVFAGWAKSLARRKRNAEEAPSKASVKPKKAEPSGKSGDKEKEKEAVDADDILASFTPRRSILYNAPTHSWF